MREIIIVKNSTTYGDDGAAGVIAGKHALASLVEGSLVCLDSDNTVVDNGAPAPSGEYVQFAIGGATARGPVVTQQVWREELSYEKLVYVAAAKKKMFLGGDNTTGSDTTGTTLNLPSAIAAGDIYGVYVTDRSKPSWDMTRTKYYSVTATASSILTGKISPNVIVDLVAVINADANRIVNATMMYGNGSDATGIQFEAVTAGVDFNISKDSEKLKDATISEYAILAGTYDGTYTTQPTAHSRGDGTTAQITAVEKDFSTEKGYDGGLWLADYFYTFPTGVDSAQNYTCYVLKFKTPDTKILSNEGNPTQELVIAVPQGDATNIASVDAILAAL